MTTRLSGAKPNYVRMAVAAILGSAVITSAWAADDTALEEVQVTGTRIQQRGEYVSPTPMATFSSADLEKLGIVNVSDAMTQIPQNVSQFTPANTGGSAFFIGSTLANLRGLNPFFGTRTLTLVDSRRFIPTTQGDAVDLNFIPSNMIQRMEVVTGGASAAYGSGAISGVVNVILDKSLRGIKIDADYGVSGEGDADSYHVGLAGGLDFAGGRGSLILGGEWQKNEVAQSCSDLRDWCAAGRGLFNNNTGFAFGGGLPYTPKIPGQPNYIWMDGLRVNQISRNGVIFSASPTATQTSQFNDAGTGVTPWNLGQYGNFGAGGLVPGGDGDRAYTNLTLFPDVERITTFSHADFQITERVGVYGELSYGQVKAENLQAETGQISANNCIKTDNGYLSTLSQAARDALTANLGNSPFADANMPCGLFVPPGTIVSKAWFPQVEQVVSTDTKVLRGVVGVNGNFAETWTWDAYYQYGKTERDQIGRNYRTNWRYTMAVDAVDQGQVTTGTPNGVIMCRVTATGILPNPGVDPSLAQGCQPLNIFGNTASAAALAYAFGDLTESNEIRQDVLAASTTGQLWEGWGAGPLAAALGIEWRKESLTNDAGDLPFALRTDFPLQYGDSFEGETEVKEAFLELEMPLLRDLPGAQLLTVNGAVRWANYETTGGMGTIGGTNSQDITTWKVAAVWDPIDWLRFRGSYSSDIRAAGFRELFYSQSIPPGGFFGNVQNPWIVTSPGVTATDASSLILSGNPAIEPEEAKTKTIGIVLTPGGVLQRTQISVDYYDIELDGGMSLEQAQLNVNDCFAARNQGQTELLAACDLLTFGPPLAGQPAGPDAQYSNITSTRALYRNLNTYSTRGVDFAVDYTLPMQAIPGTFMFRLSGSYTIETIIPSGVDVAGQVGADSGFLSDFAPSPDFSGNATVTYMNGPFAGTIQARYIAGGKLDLQNPKTGPNEEGFDPNLTNSVSDNDVGSYIIWNLNASYNLGLWGAERTEVFLSVNNLFDRDPPFAAGTFGGFGGTNPIFYDALGRFFRVGARVKF